jgi:hypothetical protein
MDAKDMSHLLVIALLKSQNELDLARDLAAQVESPRAKAAANSLITGREPKDASLRPLVAELRNSARPQSAAERTAVV